MKAILYVLCLVGLPLAANAQQARAQAALPRITADGFYKIALTPAVTAYASNFFENVRIIDSKGVQVPYLLFEEREHAKTEFVKYEIEKLEIIEDSCTIMVLKNAAKSAIDNVKLVVKNAQVYKHASLYGSDDKKTWYGLKESFVIGSVENPNGTFDIKTISFPSSDYVYYMLNIDDKNAGPLNIVEAGYYQNISGETNYQEVRAESVEQNDDAKTKTTAITIRLDTLQIIDKLTWDIDAPFYRRSAEVFTLLKRTDKKGEEVEYEEFISEFDLNSRHENVLHLGGNRLDNIVIKIDNGDNPPLSFTNIRVYQTSRYLTSWLKAGEQYSLTFGDERMEPPQYDLQYFKDMIPSSLQPITPGNVDVRSEEVVVAGATVFTTKIFIWVAIGIVIVTLGYMSLRMIRETSVKG
jgi:hypothetical protein